MRRFVILLFLSVLSLQTLFADPYGTAYHSGERNLELLRNLWLDSRNAAGLSRNPVADGGIGLAGFSTRRGDLWRVQEGNKTNRFITEADQYQNLRDSLFFYGRFCFANERQFERSWSDVFETYHTNPYLYGSAVKGSCDLQDFDLTGSIATRKTGLFTLGIRLDYRVASLARLRDPRSLTNLADYAAIPSLTCELNKHQLIGLSFSYRHHKTKTPGVSTVQTDPNLKYYTMTGLEYTTGIIGGYSSFEREYTGNTAGLTLDHAFQWRKISGLHSLTFNSTGQSVWGTNKASPGEYRETEFAYNAHLLAESGRLLQKLDLQASYRTGKANEFRQQLVSTTDTATGIVSKHWQTLFTYKSRYTTGVQTLSLRYRAFFLQSTQDYNKWLGVNGSFQQAKDQYNLPVSLFKDSRINLGIEGGFRLLHSGLHSIWIEPSLEACEPLSTELNLQDKTTDYATQVLLPDQTYYQKAYLTGAFTLKYEFPLHLGSNVNRAFLSVNGSGDRIESGYKRWSAGFTAGVFLH